MERFERGLIGEARSVVTEKDTAAHLGSGTVPVFGTPALVGLMEAAAVQALADFLPAGQTSVGAGIDVRHLAPTPVGMQVCARAELVGSEGRRLSFRIEAWDEIERIGEATHERIIIDAERFVTRASAKVR